MQCVRCHKPLKAYAKAVTTADGIAGWGPKCARMAFAAQWRPPVVGRRLNAEPADDRQIDWVQQVAAAFVIAATP